MRANTPSNQTTRASGIYNLNESPVDIKRWWELENVRLTERFFKEHEGLFQQDGR